MRWRAEEEAGEGDFWWRVCVWGEKEGGRLQMARVSVCGGKGVYVRGCVRVHVCMHVHVCACVCACVCVCMRARLCFVCFFVWP